MLNNKLRVCATGDMMLLEPFPSDYHYADIADEIAKADVRITNLESVVSDWNCFASTFCGGQWINTSSENLYYIGKYGFNLYGCANNHSMDYSYNGLLSTIKNLEQKDWKFAGIGKNLDEASGAVYLKIGRHKIAFISVTSTFIDAARAGNGRGDIPARPGVNPLRVKTVYKITRQHYKVLSDIAKETYINGERDNARKIGSLPPEQKDSINFGGNFFIISDDGTEGKITTCHEGDLNRIIAEIKKAKENADYVFISVHSHQIKKTEYSEPDYFLEEFARKCIDSGVSAIIGGGTHQLKPIEIYKGKPIFYSLGNFVFQNHLVNKLPADFWDKYGYDTKLSVKEGMAIKTKNGTIGLELDINNYVSIVAFFEFDNDELLNIELLPIELQFNGDMRHKGLPTKALGNEADYIYKHLSDISRLYNVKLSNINNRFIVKL